MLVLIFLVLLDANDVRTQLKFGRYCSFVDHTCIPVYPDTCIENRYILRHFVGSNYKLTSK